MSESLFGRIGGQLAVEAAVELFYNKVLFDPTLAEFFSEVDHAMLRKKQNNFLTLAFGGPCNESSSDLTQVHAHLVKLKGLTDHHFDSVVTHLYNTLDELGVSPELTSEVMAIVAGTRDDVLGRSNKKSA